MQSNQLPDFSLEHTLMCQGCRTIAGVDEVGRGSWAGPLVAAAVVLPTDTPQRMSHQLTLIRDSKTLSAEQRLAALEVVRCAALSIGLGWATSSEIDRIGLGPANRLAMVRAIRALHQGTDGVIVDHMRLPDVAHPQVCVRRADARSVSVAAASIVAKVMRDRLMSHWDRLCPGYGFGAHKGYGTLAHRDALSRLGPSRIHRTSFRPVRDAALRA